GPPCRKRTRRRLRRTRSRSCRCWRPCCARRRTEETIMIRVLLIAVLLAAGAHAADDFKPVKAAESVTYPLPPVPMPAVQPPDGKWTETEDSPAIRVSRAWVKLGQAAGVERSEGTRRLYQAWKGEVAQGGTHTRSAQAAHARFLAAYKHDLEEARGIYEGVLRDVDAMDSD